MGASPATQARGLSPYVRELVRLLKLHITAGASVLEVGSAYGGDVLAALEPRRGVAVTPSAALIAEARARHPHLSFVEADLETFDVGGETFDFIIVWAALGEARDVQSVLERVRAASRPDSRIVLAHPNSVWEPLLRPLTRVRRIARASGLNWLSLQDIRNLCLLAEMDIVRESAEVLLPVAIPGLHWLANNLLARLWPFTHLGMIQLIIDRTAVPPPAIEPPRLIV